jgi:SanA protein
MMRRRLLRFAFGLIVAAVVIVGAANAVVALGGGGWTRDPAAAPPAQAALVLGAQVKPDGAPSAMLDDRVRAAAALYRDRRVAKVLVSGDHGRTGYDEVGTMRRELLRLGVPAQDIFEDHAGFDTWDSMVRARKVFEVKSAIVVTQRFHLARALWLARRAGLRASGLAADARGYGSVMRSLQAREVVARVKAVGDVVSGAGPRFLGPTHPIAGDGRGTLG